MTVRAAFRRAMHVKRRRRQVQEEVEDQQVDDFLTAMGIARDRPGPDSGPMRSGRHAAD